MIELRKDYILDRWSYIAADRGKRFQQFEKNANSDDKNNACFFCPGNENLTPPETGRTGNKDRWKLRWFPNKFPVVNEKSNGEITTSNKFYTLGGAFGCHEVIVETPNHNKQLADLKTEDISELLKIYSLRIKELSKKKNIKYVQIFKNSGPEAGTSLAHTHTQIIATSIIPGLVREKIEAVKKYKKCPYCDIIKKEEKSGRFVYSNNDFLAFTPFAPRFNFEVWIFPQKHHKNITELNCAEFENLAKAFKKVLSRLGEVNASYNFYLHYSPGGDDLHFHFEITPRLNKWAGFELATDSYVITVSPEDAAKFYRK